MWNYGGREGQGIDFMLVRQKDGEYRQVGEVRNNVKQSPPLVAFSLMKEQGFEQPRRR
jgi:hypothetical protein